MSVLRLTRKRAGGGDFFGREELADEEGDDVLKVHIEVLAGIGIRNDDVARQIGRERQQDVAFSACRCPRWSRCRAG
jgi:hypothetical protein